MEIHCHDCGSTQIRRSRLRLSDLKKLVLLRYPIRCVACYTRGFAWILDAFSISHKPQNKIAR
jgi:hypothetical protein